MTGVGLMQDPGHVTNATALPGHRKNLLCDFKHAALMTGFDQKRLLDSSDAYSGPGVSLGR